MIVSCPHCQKKFKTDQELSNSELTLECQFCGQAFSVAPPPDRLARLETTGLTLPRLDPIPEDQTSDPKKGNSPLNDLLAELDQQEGGALSGTDAAAAIEGPSEEIVLDTIFDDLEIADEALSFERATSSGESSSQPMSASRAETSEPPDHCPARLNIKKEGDEGAYFKVNSIVSDFGKKKPKPAESDLFDSDSEANDNRNPALHSGPLQIENLAPLDTARRISRVDVSGRNTRIEGVLSKTNLFSRAVIIPDSKPVRGGWLASGIFFFLLIALSALFILEFFPERGTYRYVKSLIVQRPLGDGNNQLLFDRAYRGEPLGYSNLIFLEGIVRNLGKKPKTNFQMRISLIPSKPSNGKSPKPTVLNVPIGDPIQPELLKRITSADALDNLQQEGQFKEPLGPLESRAFLIPFYDPTKAISGYRIESLN